MICRDKYVNASVVIFEKVCLIRPSLALLTTANIDLLDYNNTLDLPTYVAFSFLVATYLTQV